MLGETRGKMFQSNSRIFKFSWLFRCLLLVTLAENSSPSPVCLGTSWMGAFIVSLLDYRKLAAGLTRAVRQTAWWARGLHILSVRSCFPGASPPVPRVRAPCPLSRAAQPGDAGRGVRGCPAALTASSLAQRWAHQGAVVHSVDISLLALGSHFCIGSSAFWCKPASPQSQGAGAKPTKFMSPLIQSYSLTLRQC